ncbi:MAG: hypothetical protein A3D16_20715 [Rhodobacterales bacterium RIFCSPHIGHO2_02_FULL_62_130]|nr:MAG: hypothetical protein A3D16_20715 [Rhodobacterales bacterium RIFCSPHIGHO2_02_FULL_62_130]OHC58187.1 MAG: hypothetical protein A3E48_12365 [Rhodobacterales bacterium RIFCSPHIGHO2_12_FULL_62_75]HCY99801.1 hypothetical protein [Rhodobacter sp.]
MPELPLTLLQSLERRLVSATAVATSPFTGSEQVQDWGGEWWEYGIEMARTNGRDGRRLSAFLTALGGLRGRFLFRDPTIRQPGIAYTPTVAGAGQSGGTLNTNGWPASSTPLFAGDFFSLGVDHQTRLYQLTADVISNASGLATLSFVPRLRASPTDGAALEIAAPAVLLRLTAPVPTRIGRADTFLFTLTAREAL